MFRNATGLTSLDLSGWDTSAVTNITYMFYGVNSLKKVTANTYIAIDKFTSLLKILKALPTNSAEKIIIGINSCGANATCLSYQSTLTNNWDLLETDSE